MTVFLRLLAEEDKGAALREVCSRQRAEGRAGHPLIFEVAPDAFDAVPGKPFAYWVSEAVRQAFGVSPPFNDRFLAIRGAYTTDDFRFYRLTWEPSASSYSTTRQDSSRRKAFVKLAKGGAWSPYYSDIHLAVLWQDDGAEAKAHLSAYRQRKGWGTDWSACLNGYGEYFRPGLTWPRRTTSGLSLRAMPAGCIFADKGPAVFVADDDPEELLALLALTNSRAFELLVSLQLAAADAAARSYEVGVIQKTPVPPLPSAIRLLLAAKARRAWSLKCTLDTVNETSHAFLLPAALQRKECTTEDTEITEEEEEKEIEFSVSSVVNLSSPASVVNPSDLLSWCVGVAFGRFDWRLATGEREPPPEPDPFDPLPAKSPGMLPDGAEPFHVHPGILVDDPGHPHDLAQLIEEVLARVDVAAPNDVRRWLQRDFFPFHLQRYSKSRRKAPFYWPLATASGSYTLWVYYPSLGSQTLYTAVNDFVEPRLQQVGGNLSALRTKGSARTREDERRFEALQTIELELIELSDTLLRLAPTYKPNHDDGVQITAAPLWPLFRHKPWRKVLKDTWEKLIKGDYDWAHLAMNYRLERVREKCKTDKSLAIAHGLEDLYVEPAAKPKGTRGRKKTSIAGQVKIHGDILSTVPESDWDLPR